MFFYLKNTVIIICLCIIFFVSAAAQAYGSLSISPAFLELSLDRGRPSGQFTIGNTGDTTVRYRIQASHFTFGQDGGFQIIPPDENSLANWIKFNPRELELAPRTRQQVRFVIIPRGNIQDQLYWGAMELESLEPNIARGDDKHGRTMTLAVIPSIVVPIFAAHGQMHYDFELNEIVARKNDQGLEFYAAVNNTGTGQLMLEGNFELVDAAGDIFKDGKFIHTYIMPDSSLKKTGFIEDQIPAGEYILKVKCWSNEISKEASTSVNIP